MQRELGALVSGTGQGIKNGTTKIFLSRGELTSCLVGHRYATTHEERIQEDFF